MPSAARVLLAVATDAARERRVRKLEAAGLTVTTAPTGFATIVKATCSLPEAILLDPTLGAEAIADTKQLLLNCPSTQHIPVVALTVRTTVPRRLLRTPAI